MALMPKNVKFRKTQRGRLKGMVQTWCYLQFGEYGIQATEAGWITSQQIESARVVARHFVGSTRKVSTSVSFPTATSLLVLPKLGWVRVKVCPTNGLPTSVLA